MQILWERKAIRQMRRIPQQDRSPIFEKVRGLARWPDCPNVKALKHHEYQYRLRVGRYRVFFNVEVEVNILKIEEVKKRDERTY
jgi:mRNA-degrading endonuclease RelE of RelBE toxin-antitoxin system